MLPLCADDQRRRIIIRFENVTKRFGALTAVHDHTIEVPAGELFGFLGPNGAGKTTTIRMATGMLRPSAGTIHVAGYNVYKQGKAARASLGYVLAFAVWHQAPAFFYLVLIIAWGLLVDAHLGHGRPSSDADSTIHSHLAAATVRHQFYHGYRVFD